jgi:limonene-1,2-epoxide hydrolase
MMKAMTLIQFLNARIGEDERDARAAAARAGFEWRVDGDQVVGGTDRVATLHDEECGPHITRWDPVRVIAECAVKGRILEEYADLNIQALERLTEPTAALRFKVIDRVVHFLAESYADHPDYAPAWRL